MFPNSSNSLDGYYGESMPKDLGVDVSTFSGENAGASISGIALPETCTIKLDHAAPVGNNSLSSLAAAQLMMRLVLHRELPLGAQFPLLQWSDIQELLYGAGARSRLFPGQLWGGMSADTGGFHSFTPNADCSAIHPLLQPYFCRMPSTLCCRWTTSMQQVTANGAYSVSSAMATATLAV